MVIFLKFLVLSIPKQSVRVGSEFGWGIGYWGVSWDLSLNLVLCLPELGGICGESFHFTKKKRTIGFWFGEVLVRKLDHSSQSELSDVYVLSLEDGWVIMGIFTVGRRVEDCVYFFYSSFLLSKNPLVIVWGQAVLSVQLRKSMPGSFQNLHSDSIPSSKNLSLHLDKLPDTSCELF